MRPRQWPKNLLVFAAPVAAGVITDGFVLRRSVLALFVMTCASIGTYLTNDLLDRAADREHELKQHRPIASGALQPGVAAAAAALSAFVALALPWLLGAPDLTWIVVAYLAVQVLYFAWAKRQPVFDLATVASGFVLRAVAGGVAAGIAISSWFLTVTGAVAVFVVAGKRYSELVAQGTGSRAALRLYSRGYLRFIWSVAAAVAVVFYALWANEMAQNGPSSLAAQLSTIPFVLLLLRYARDIDDACAEAPERVVLSDAAFVVLGLLWVGLFTLQAFT
jgi:decaprenyl-phosphate phosphoribosyltransferase